MKPRKHVIFTFLITILFAAGAFAQNTISTVAGTGTGGYSGDGGQATAAQINTPFGVAVDAQGNFYIAEWSNHVVRKVSASGVISLFAGTPAGWGFGGDGGPATSAALNSPEGVAVDAAGNVYIADSFNNRIRKVSASGVITTVAGNGQPRYTGEGVATEVGLNDPSGVAVDNSGNLYIADNSSHRVRKVVLSTGIISTIAGTGTAGFSGDGGPAATAQLNNPTHLSVDSAGNIYIADYSNNRVRKISSSGIITTVAGSQTLDANGYFSGDGGPATEAQFAHPAGVVADSAGNLYIADAGNSRVRKVEAGTGIISTIAGGGTNGDGCNSDTAKLNFPIDVATTASGSNIYISDYGDNRIRMITTADNGSLPHVSSMTPSGGISGRSYNVTLTGSDFVVGGGSGCASSPTTVSIAGAGVSVSNVSLSSSTITFTLTVAADAPAGSDDVKVTTSRGTSNPMPFKVGLATPALTSISPSSGLRGTTVTVTLTGTDFTPGETTVKISSGGVTVSNVNAQSSTSATATFTIDSAANIGKYFVFVETTHGGDSNSVQFTVGSSTPTLTGLSPTSGRRGTTTRVTLTGANFSATSPTVKISPAGIAVSDVTVVDDTTMAATFTVDPAATLGNYSVFLSSSGGDSTALQFRVVSTSPTLTSISPATGLRGTTVQVTLTGSNFSTSSPTVKISPDGIGVNNVTLTSDTSMTATFVINPTAALGNYNVFVSSAAGGDSGTVTFRVVSSTPALTSISPTSGLRGTTLQVTLTGTNFSGTSPTLKVSPAGITVSNVAVVNDTSMTATFVINPTAALGNYNVFVSSAAGGDSGTVTFRVVSSTPTLTSISPTSGLRGTTLQVTLTGTNFSTSSPTVKVSPAGIGVDNVTIVNDTTLTAKFTINPTAALGNYLVFVSSAAGGDSGTVTFRVVSSTPTLTSISPTSGLRGTTLQVTLTGTSFSGTSPTLKVSPAGITVSNVAVVNDTSITATFTIGSTAILGNYYVFVSTAAGGDSESVVFAVNPQGPAITFGIPQQLNPTQQVPVQLSMPSSLPDTVTGSLTITFNPNTANNADDPNVTFIGTQSSGRTIGFQFPANTTTAQFSVGNAVLQAGTVAGTIRLTLTDVKSGGQSVTPPSTTWDVTIPQLAPVITNVRLLNRTSQGFDVEVTGYSDTREITQATFQFAAGGGGNLQTAQLQPDVAGTFTTYFQSPGSAAVGSAFVYTQPFIAEQGDANVVTSVTVSLANSKGTSEPKTAP